MAWPGVPIIDTMNHKLRSSYPRLRRDSGYTLVEIIVVIIIIGILATTAFRSMKGVSDVTRVEETRQTMDRLAIAIVGDPNCTSEGSRTNYGYVGDVGALPPNLTALVQNPGGYTTWHGPYVRDLFTTGGANSSYAQDAWGNAISYSGGTSLSSTGGGSPLTRSLANSASAILSNRVSVVVTDLDRNLPGTSFKDSVRFVLTFPNGSGGTTTRTKNPNRNGLAQFDSIPIGLHSLRVVYTPTNDTVTRYLNVNQGEDTYSEISLYRSLW